MVKNSQLRELLPAFRQGDTQTLVVARDFRQWSHRDQKGYWTLKEKVDISIFFESVHPGSIRLSLLLEPLLAPGASEAALPCVVYLGDGVSVKTSLHKGENNVSITIPSLGEDRHISLAVSTGSMSTPYELGYSQDQRKLGFRFLGAKALSENGESVAISEISLGADHGKPDQLFLSKNPTEKLIVCFTSFGIENEDIDVFEFYGALKNKHANLLFLRDRRRAWYLTGVRGYAKSADELSVRISSCVNESFKNSIFVGVSMGGYAALLFGALLGAQKIVAFSPQVRLDSGSRASMGDKRWAGSVNQLNSWLAPLALDEFLGQVQSPPEATVYVSSHNALDLAHAALLSKIPWITVIEVDSDAHNVAKVLQSRGAFTQIF